MDKATRAIRRGGIRLKSMNSGHTELNLVISGLKDLKAGMKSFQRAQTAVVNDMMVWSRVDEHQAVQDVLEQVNDLHNVWVESQKNALEQLKAFKHQCELILEGEKVVDSARASLVQAEQKEEKLKKLAKKTTDEEMVSLEIKLSEAKRAKDLAQFEAVKQINENESCKLIRLKEGLTKLSESFTEMAQKMVIVFDAQKQVVQALPDANDTPVHDLEYTGHDFTKQVVREAKSRISQLHTPKSKSALNRTNSSVDEPPPPYTSGVYDPVAALPYERGAESINVGVKLARNSEPTAPLLEEQESVEGH